MLALLVLTFAQVGRAQSAGPAPASRDKATRDYLDGRAAWWLGWSVAARGQGTVCVSCHTAVPFALVRPALARRLGETSAGEAEGRLVANVRKRVENWDKIVSDSISDKDPYRPYYGGDRRPSALGTEAVINALVLVNHDAWRGGGRLSEQSNKALDYLWDRQQANGAWPWLDFGLRPWEKDGECYGAALAAVAVGTAGDRYPRHAAVREKVAALRQYLRTAFPDQPLHNRVMVLWASAALPDVLGAEEKKKLIEATRKAQETDGGWSLPKLGKTTSGAGQWERHGTYPEDGVSDGYATGLIVLALRRAGVPADDPGLERATRWLAASQKEGAWPATYINRPRNPHDDIGKFMRDAATAFAALALAEFD